MSEKMDEPVKDAVSVLWSNVKSLTQTSLVKSKVASKKMSYRVKRSLLYHDRNKLFQELGETTFRLMEKGALDANQLKNICDRIEKINHLITQQSQAIEE